MAAGAVSYYLDHFVVGRLVRYTYGIPASIMYDPSDPEHRKRAHKKYLGITGVPRLDVFSPTLFKVASVCFQVAHLGLTNVQGMRVSGTQEFRDEVPTISMFPPVAGQISEFPIIRYMGKSKKPQWMDEEQSRCLRSSWDSRVLEATTGKFKEMCHISADASKAPYTVGRSLLGFPIFIQEFEIIYIYGQTTEVKAQVAWMEDVRLFFRGPSLVFSLTPLTKFTIGYRETVCLSERNAFCMLTFLQ